MATVILPQRSPALPGEDSYAAELTALDALLASLDREQRLLSDARPPAEAIEALVAEKQVLVDRIYAIRRARPAARANDAASALVSGTVLEMRRRIRASAERAQALNQANERLLAIHRRACESRLQALRGQARPNSLYGRTGQAGH